MSSLIRLSRAVLAILVFSHAAALLAQQQKPREQDDPYQRDQWFMRGRTVNGKPGAAELHRAWQQKMNARAARARASAMRGATSEGAPNQVNSAGAAFSITNTTTPNGAVWTPLGPAPALTAAPCPAQFCQSQDYGPAVGRITTVVVDPADSTGNTVYIGGATGGLWKSTNAAEPTRDCTSSGTGSCIAPNVTWTPLIDSQPSLTVGAMALQPGNSQLMIVGTGEANSSADSYYGQGFLRSINAGSNWTPISTATVNGTATDLTGIGFLKIAFSTDNTNVVVAAGASSSMGPQTGAQQSSDNRLGLYYSLDSGATWTRATVTDGTAGTPDPGSATDVIYNHAAGKFFAALRFHGMYSSSDGINWTRLASQPPPAVSNCTPTLNRSCNFYRAALALVPGRNEMYAFIVDASDNDQGIYQTLDGGNTWTSVPTAGMVNCGDGSGNGCDTDQGSYNLTIAAIPNGSNTDLYTGAVNEFKCTLTGTGPATSSCSFINLTHVYGCPTNGYLATGANVHPDEHGIAFVSDATKPIYFGNDGGIYRVLSPQNLADNCPGSQQPRTGSTLFDNLDANMGSMMQFVSFSQHPTDDTILFGGTQDNGTPKKDSSAGLNTSGYGYQWGTTHIGDGGYTDLNPLNNDWFASYAQLFIQRCAGKGSACTDADYPPDSTQIDSTKVNGDAATFYPVYMLDPGSLNSLAATTQMVLGTCRIWRGSSDGTTATAGNPGWSPGSPISNNFDTNSNSTCSSSSINFISALAVGGPTAAATSTHPVISKVIYAGTEGFPTSAGGGSGSGGQLFVTFNADTAAPSTNVGPGSGWANITAPGAAACTATASACNINPGHYNISGVAIDPSDATGKTAYVTVMGFHVAHVLKTTDGGATWAALDGTAGSATGLPDAPADSVAVHPTIPGQIYVGTDIGVFAYDPVQKTWSEEGPVSGSGFLPEVAVTKVAIFNSGGILKLRASTYGRGIWETAIPANATPDFFAEVSSATLAAYPGQAVTFSGTITYFNGYNKTITISCQGAAPGTCNVGTQPLANDATSFNVTVSNPSAADFNFTIRAAGSDGTTHTVPVTLHVVDFTLGNPTPSSVTVPDGTPSQAIAFTVSPQASFSQQLNFTCTSSNPLAPVSCQFTPSASPTISAATNMSVVITGGPFATAGTYPVTITAATTDAQLSHTKSVLLTITSNATVILACTTCSGSPATKIPVIKATQQGSATVAVSGQDGYTGNFNSLTCQVAPTSGPAPACSVSPGSVSPVLLNPASTPVTLSLQGLSGGTGTLTISGTATGPVTNSPLPLVLAYDIGDFTVAAAQAANVVPGGSVNLQFPVASVASYAASLNVSCSTSDPSVTCTALSPVTLSANGAATVTTVVSASNSASATDRTVAVMVTDSALPSLGHNSQGVLHVQDFQVAASPASNTIKAGASSQHNISLTSLNGLSGNVTLTVSGCPATALMTCTLSSTSPTLTSAAPATVTLNITTTAATATLGAPPLPRRGSPLFAFWLGLPAIALGFVGVGSATSGAGAPPNSRRRLFPRGSRWTLLAISALALLMLLAACGGGGSGSKTPPPTPQPGTPAGSYTITVTATAGSGSNSVTHIQTINLTVQ